LRAAEGTLESASCTREWYDRSMTPVAERKLSISLDEDLVRSLEGVDESVSRQINAAVREDLARRARRHELVAMLDQLDAVHGPVDEDGIRRFEELLA
jgi:hypothetical protein